MQAASRPGRWSSSGGSRRRTGVDRPGAARVERASRRELARVGRVAGQAGGRVPRGRVAHPRERRTEGRRVGVQRVAEQPVGGALLDHAAAVHHRDPVAHVGEHRQVVADQHHPDTELLHQVRQHAEDLCLDHHVERGGRLVGDHQRGPAGQRHRDHHALPLPAGELVGVGLRPRRRHPDLLEELADPALHRSVGDLRLVEPDRLGDLLPDPAYGVQRVQRALEHDRRAGPAQRAQVAPAHAQHVVAVDQDPTGHGRVGRLEPEHRAGQRRLAAAGLAGHADDLAALDGQVHLAHRGQRPVVGPVGHRELLDLQQAHRSRSLGLRISSRAWPTSVNDSTTRTTHTPGGTKNHHEPVVIAPTL